jgi:hypothetical protein
MQIALRKLERSLLYDRTREQAAAWTGGKVGFGRRSQKGDKCVLRSGLRERALEVLAEPLSPQRVENRLDRVIVLAPDECRVDQRAEQAPVILCPLEANVEGQVAGRGLSQHEESLPEEPSPNRAESVTNYPQPFTIS